MGRGKGSTTRSSTASRRVVSQDNAGTVGVPRSVLTSRCDAFGNRLDLWNAFAGPAGGDGSAAALGADAAWRFLAGRSAHWPYSLEDAPSFVHGTAEVADRG